MRDLNRGPFVYGGAELERINVAGGYIASDTAHYFIADHQGSVRKVVDGKGRTVEETLYYPWRQGRKDICL